MQSHLELETNSAPSREVDELLEMASEQGRPVEEASEALRGKEREPTPELASKVAVPAEETRERPHVAAAVPGETHIEKHEPATRGIEGKHAAAPGGGTTTTATQPEEQHKPGFVEHMKEKMVEVKDKLTGHEHQGSPKHQEPTATESPHQTTDTTPKSPKSPSFFQRIKEKLPGGHSHEPKSPVTTPVVPHGERAAPTKVTETAPLHSTTTTTTPAEDPHHEGLSEKMSHLFKGHGSETTGKHGSKDPHDTTESDTLKG
ncbi:hypothetical protein R1sor_014688 [Riccia sorocarpa]|uniref:Uncharacterized protein n=1 Tax=Riccia sorocarpa TaxID=122646 RepID=A0ABD3HCZ2_9MARC